MGIAMRHLPLVLAALVAIFLVAPMAIIVPMSFSKAISFEFPPPGYWTGYYAQYFSNESWLDATVNSFIIALGSMIFTLLVALPAAFGFVRYRFRGKGALNLLMILPIIVPAVVSALGYYGFLSLMRLVGTYAGMIIAHSVLSIPIAFLVITAALKGFDRNLERAAMSAGAGPLRTFFWVTLPVLRPGILVGALFAFLHSFNEAVVAIFIAGRDASTLPKKMFEAMSDLVSLGENMSFNPWHGLDDHEPLGSINTARRWVYRDIARFRRDANHINAAAMPEIQHRSWDELQPYVQLGQIT